MPQRKFLSAAQLARLSKAKTIPSGLSAHDRAVVQALRRERSGKTPTKLQASALRGWKRSEKAKKRQRASRKIVREVKKAPRRRASPLDRASRAANEYARKHEKRDPDIRDSIKVFFLPDDKSKGRARWSVKSWKKFMQEEKYSPAVSDILLSGDFILGTQGEDGDLEDEIETLIEGV